MCFFYSASPNPVAEWIPLGTDTVFLPSDLFLFIYLFCQQTVHVVPQISGCTSALSSPALSIEIHFICFVTDMQVALAYYSLELKTSFVELS